MRPDGIVNLSDVDPPASPDPTPQEIPGSWDEIGPGHVVIAKETSECGWWDAVVVERTGDLVTVRTATTRVARP
jgi:hypothetical protein